AHADCPKLTSTTMMMNLVSNKSNGNHAQASNGACCHEHGDAQDHLYANLDAQYLCEESVEHSRQSKNYNPYTYCCGACDESFGSPEELEQHIRICPSRNN
ncbi:hypothetical protein H4219_005266, partial [Mycoemilia scoparia]